MLDEWFKNIQIVLLGPRCLLCRNPTPLARELCDGCMADLPWARRSCRCCALALPEDSASALCPDCQPRPRFDAAATAFAYQEPVRWLVAGLKFRGQLSHARLLGDLLADRIAASGLKPPDALLPVPLHKTSYRRRGFNQAERIATQVGQRLTLPVARDAVMRIRDTASQSALTASRRRANVRGAFATRERLHGRHLAIVDDVVTTTQTATAVAEALRRAGAERIDLYCVARA